MYIIKYQRAGTAQMIVHILPDLAVGKVRRGTGQVTHELLVHRTCLERQVGRVINRCTETKKNLMPDNYGKFQNFTPTDQQCIVFTYIVIIEWLGYFSCLKC